MSLQSKYIEKNARYINEQDPMSPFYEGAAFGSTHNGLLKELLPKGDAAKAALPRVW